MIAHIHNTKTVLKAQGVDDSKALHSLSEVLSANDHHDIFLRDTGEVFDPSNPSHLERARDTTRSERFANWCHFHLTGNFERPGKVEGGVVRWGPEGMYDGYKTVAPVHGASCTLPAGLTKEALIFLQGEGVEVKVADERMNRVALTQEAVHGVGGFTLRPDQAAVIDRVRDTLLDREGYGHLFHTVLLDLAVNTGKTILIGALVRNMRHPKALLPFMSADLAARAVADYMEMGFTVGAIVADTAGVRRVLKARGIEGQPLWGAAGEVTVAMVQTMHKRLDTFPATLLESFNGLIVDECDTFTHAMFRGILERLRPGLTVGLSGTPLSSPLGSDRLAVLGLFGAQRYRISTADNVERGISLRPVVRFNMVDLTAYAHFPIGRAKYYALLSETSPRVLALREMLDRWTSEGAQVVVFTGEMQVKHGEILADLITAWGHDNRYIHGEVKDRDAHYAAFNERQFPVLVANSVLTRGVNLPAINVWVQWDATDNPAALVQGAIGRSVRLDGVSKTVTIEDFWDAGHGMMAMSSARRAALYADPANGAVVEFLYLHDGKGVPQ